MPKARTSNVASRTGTGTGTGMTTRSKGPAEDAAKEAPAPKRGKRAVGPAAPAPQPHRQETSAKVQAASTMCAGVSSVTENTQKRKRSASSASNKGRASSGPWYIYVDENDESARTHRNICDLNPENILPDTEHVAIPTRTRLSARLQRKTSLGPQPSAEVIQGSEFKTQQAGAIEKYKDGNQVCQIKRDDEQPHLICDQSQKSKTDDVEESIVNDEDQNACDEKEPSTKKPRYCTETSDLKKNEDDIDPPMVATLDESHISLQSSMVSLSQNKNAARNIPAREVIEEKLDYNHNGENVAAETNNARETESLENLNYPNYDTKNKKNSNAEMYYKVEEKITRKHQNREIPKNIETIKETILQDPDKNEVGEESDKSDSGESADEMDADDSNEKNNADKRKKSRQDSKAVNVNTSQQQSRPCTSYNIVEREYSEDHNFVSGLKSDSDTNDDQEEDDENNENQDAIANDTYDDEDNDDENQHEEENLNDEDDDQNQNEDYLSATKNFYLDEAKFNAMPWTWLLNFITSESLDKGVIHLESFMRKSRRVIEHTYPDVPISRFCNRLREMLIDIRSPITSIGYYRNQSIEIAEHDLNFRLEVNLLIIYVTFFWSSLSPISEFKDQLLEIGTELTETEVNYAINNVSQYITHITDGIAMDGHTSTYDVAVRDEILDFTSSFKGLTEKYRILDKIGEGTFSSVYKAVDKCHYEFENPWCSSCMIRRYGVNDTSKCNVVAIKRIYATSQVDRIYNEIEILKLLSGHRNIAPIISAFRCQDQIIAVLPFYVFDEFKTFVADCSISDMQYYFISLFGALSHVHAHGIIHRDIKPTNFLYNRKLKTGVLVDFGLAQRAPLNPNNIPNATNGGHSKTPTKSKLLSQREKENMYANAPRTKPPGYYPKDTRPAIRGASRAGTRGFRAPEVLLRVVHQTTAIDIWSAGVIMVILITKKYPFFNSNDDIEALMEISQIFGKRAMMDIAAFNNRIFTTNVPNIKNPISFKEICQKLGELRRPHKPWKDPLPDIGYDFLNQCLNLRPDLRITARQALEHPFLNNIEK